MRRLAGLRGMRRWSRDGSYNHKIPAQPHDAERLKELHTLIDKEIGAPSANETVAVQADCFWFKTKWWAVELIWTLPQKQSRPFRIMTLVTIRHECRIKSTAAPFGQSFGLRCVIFLREKYRRASPSTFFAIATCSAGHTR